MNQPPIKLPLVAGALLLMGVAAAAQSPRAFAAVSVRPSGPHARQSFRADPAGLHIANQTLRQLIDYAYSTQDIRITGWVAAMASGDWTQWHRFNVDATTGTPATDAELRLMLRDVLTTRFGLRLRKDTKDTPLFALVVAPGGIKFKPVGAGGTWPDAGQRPGMMTVRMGTIAVLVSRLNLPDAQASLKRRVIDQTGMSGNYYLGLTLPVEDATVPGGPERSRFVWSWLPKALAEDGLALKPITAPYTTYTIESAHEPTAN